MTKPEAQAAMKEGKKVTHRYFGPDEWIKYDDKGRLVDETGLVLSEKLFWGSMTEDFWETGWSIYEPKQPLK